MVIIMQAAKNTTSITIRMDADLKKQAETLFDDMGLNMTTAFTVFAKAVVREGCIPFEIKADPFWSEANQAELRRRIADMDAGRNMSEHELIEVEPERGRKFENRTCEVDDE